MEEMLSKEEDMGFTRSTTDISVHQKLGDYPNQENGMTPEDLKKRYDLPAEILQKDLNKLEEELESVIGASNVGALTLDVADDSNNNVQAKLEYIYGQLQNVALGQIPDGSITEAKLETNYANTLPKKNGELQENLNAEKIGGKTYADVQEEIANQKALYVEDSFTFSLPAGVNELLQKEYQLDGTRIILIAFKGATNDSNIGNFVVFDCATNTIIQLINNSGITTRGIFMTEAQDLNYTDFAYGGANKLKLNGIFYNNDTKKITFEYIKQSRDSNGSNNNYLTTKIYAISGKI
jgi:hypothetical protein